MNGLKINTDELKMQTNVCIGDFIVKLIDNCTLRVTTDRGVINVRPKADNSVEIKSTKGQ